MTKMRKIRNVLKSKPTMEGAGVRLHRAFGFGQVPIFDPFLLLDDFRQMARFLRPTHRRFSNSLATLRLQKTRMTNRRTHWIAPPLTRQTKPHRFCRLAGPFRQLNRRVQYRDVPNS